MSLPAWVFDTLKGTPVPCKHLLGQPRGAECVHGALWAPGGLWCTTCRNRGELGSTDECSRCGRTGRWLTEVSWHALFDGPQDLHEGHALYLWAWLCRDCRRRTPQLQAQAQEPVDVTCRELEPVT